MPASSIAPAFVRLFIHSYAADQTDDVLRKHVESVVVARRALRSRPSYDGRAGGEGDI